MLSERQTERQAKPWQRRASPFARQSLLCFVLLVIYASLYPFDFQPQAVGPFDYLLAPLPQYLTLFDVFVNVIGYLPLGLLVVLALHPRWRGTAAVLAALVAGALLSGSMEALQTYLPSRVASNIDLATNSMGALIGGAIGVPLASPLLDRGWLRHWRFAWFERYGSAVLILLALWPLAQAYPQQFLFGNGDLVRQIWLWQDQAVTDTILEWLPRLAGLIDYLDALDAVAGQIMWETVVTACGTLAAGLLLTLPMRRAAPRGPLLCALLAGGLAVKVIVAAWQFSPVHALDWLTPGAFNGLVLGAILLMVLAWTPRAVRAVTIFVALALMIALVNVLPANPYYEFALQAWRQGQYVHFNMLARWLSWTWPYLVLVYLLSLLESAYRRKQMPDRHRRA